MPRTARMAPSGLVCHARNRAAARLPLFEKDADSAASERITAEAIQRYPTKADGSAAVLRVRAEDAMSVYWEKILLDEFSLERRLARMPVEQVISFAAGCAEHVVRHFICVYDAQGADAAATSPFIDAWQDALSECWAVAIGKSRGDGCLPNIDRINGLFVGESALDTATRAGAYNIDQVTAAVYKALECAKHSGHPGYAVGAAHSAYEAVALWYVMGTGESVTWAADESLRQQAECVECLQEIAFQKRYLTALTKLSEEVPLYETVLAVAKLN